VMSDIRKPVPHLVGESPYLYADVMDYNLLERIIVEHNIDWVIHFSALLSAVGEKMIQKALDVNIRGFQNVLDLGKTTLISKRFL